MSTVPEVIAAVHMGLPVLAISVITDLCSPGKLKRVAIADILRVAADAEPRLTALLRAIIEAIEITAQLNNCCYAVASPGASLAQRNSCPTFGRGGASH